MYNELRRENVLKTERGDGTYVASGKQTLKLDKRKSIVTDVLRQAAIQAIQLELSLDQVTELLEKEYVAIVSQRSK